MTTRSSGIKAAVSRSEPAGGWSADTPTPRTGQVYRDGRDRSLLVLQVNHGSVLVEFADGTVKTVRRRDWAELRPRKASF